MKKGRLKRSLRIFFYGLLCFMIPIEALAQRINCGKGIVTDSKR